MQQPPLIKYNLKERGREYRGKARNFDSAAIKAIVDSINSPATQERVSTRAMLGYFGHWPRVRFGMEPAEGGLAEGKAHAIEPAVVTTHVKAYDDGTVEHQTEFLDNATGQLASRMFSNRVGGFSSAIDPRMPELFGFDYVNDPNYSTNRGYDLVLDSVGSGDMTFDDVLSAEQNDQIEAMNRLFDMMESSMNMALDSAARFEQENGDLLDMLAKREESVQMAADATRRGENEAQQLERDRKFFMDSALPSIQNPKKQEETSRDYLKLTRRMFPHV